MFFFYWRNGSDYAFSHLCWVIYLFIYFFRFFFVSEYAADAMVGGGVKNKRVHHCTAHCTVSYNFKRRDDWGV